MFGLTEKRRLDATTAVVALCLAGLLFWASQDVKDFGSIGVGSAFVPKLTAALFLLVGLATLGSLWKADSGRQAVAEPDAEESSEQAPGGIPAVALSVVLMVAYVSALDWLGFLLASAIYAFAQMMILCKERQRRYLSCVLAAVIPAVAFYFLFVELFDIGLPAGVLG